MTNAIRLYRTYILSENVPMNTNKIGSGHLFSPGTEKDAMSYTRAYFFKKRTWSANRLRVLAWCG